MPPKRRKPLQERDPNTRKNTPQSAPAPANKAKSRGRSATAGSAGGPRKKKLKASASAEEDEWKDESDGEQIAKNQNELPFYGPDLPYKPMPRG
jgi:hypothetical protein